MFADGSTLAQTSLETLTQAGLGGDPLSLLIALLAIAIVIIVGRFVLAVAWRLITIVIVVVALLFVLSTLGVV